MDMKEGVGKLPISTGELPIHAEEEREAGKFHDLYYGSGRAYYYIRVGTSSNMFDDKDWRHPDHLILLNIFRSISSHPYAPSSKSPKLGSFSKIRNHFPKSTQEY
jgi:hypothetical protein